MQTAQTESQQNRIREGLVHVGVKLDVDRVGELHSEPVGQRPGRDHAASGDRNDHRGAEPELVDLECKVVIVTLAVKFVS